MRFHIIGAGLSGSTAARFLKDTGHQVEIWETRNHVGGNCHDERIDGVTIHRYGPHLFHSDNEMVWRFLSRFTSWTGYRHKVVADTALGRIPIPYSQVTEERIGRQLSDDEIRDLIFRDYSRKQWGVPWEELPNSIRNRVPKRRNNQDDRYFTDRWQGQPTNGYAAMFRNLQEGIPVHLGTGKNEWKKHRKASDWVVFTGKIDVFFDECLGCLPYRSLRFEHEKSPTRLPHAVINQCNDLPFTRVYDHAWFSGENPDATVITREYPEGHHSGNEAYYPMPFGEGMRLYARYKQLAEHEFRTLFIGRLATYTYLDMWMAVAQAMARVRPFLSQSTGTTTP